jgi:hypothetical protein
VPSLVDSFTRSFNLRLYVYCGIIVSVDLVELLDTASMDSSRQSCQPCPSTSTQLDFVDLSGGVRLVQYPLDNNSASICYPRLPDSLTAGCHISCNIWLWHACSPECTGSCHRCFNLVHVGAGKATCRDCIPLASSQPLTTA